MLKIILLATSLLLIGSQAAPIVERYGLSDYAVYVKLPSKTIGRSANGTVIGPDSAKYPGFNHMVSARPFGFYVDRDFYGPYFKCFVANNTEIDQDVRFTVTMKGKEAVIKCDDHKLDVQAECELDRKGTSSTVFYTNKAGETKLTKTGLWMDVRPTIVTTSK